MKRILTNEKGKIALNKSLILIKIIFIILLLNLILLFRTEVNASEVKVGTYGKDYFGEEYSNGYIRWCSSADIIETSSGISVKTAKQIYSSTKTADPDKFYNANNTSKSEYIDYSKAARTINSNGEPIWLDMRIYFWTNNRKYPWSFCIDKLVTINLYELRMQYTTMEFHFYTTGHCGEDNYEQSFKGIIKFDDLDTSEGVMLYSGFNQIYFQAGRPIIYVAKGSRNSSNGNNPFNTTGIATYPYFFGTRINNSTDNVWLEVNSTLNSPFTIAYSSRDGLRLGLYYTGTAIEYYVDGVLKDTSYCVPYGRYKLIDTSKLDAQKYGYNIDGWYTDTSYTTKANDGMAGTNTIRVYGKYIRYTITVDNEREGHAYNSYQVFKGDYSEKEKKIINENGEEKIIKIPILSNIEWSKELQKEVEKGKTHGDRIIEILKENEKDKVESNKLYSNCKTADDIAKVLQGKPNDGDAIKEFTDIVGKYILDNDIPITKGTNTVVEENDRNGNVIDKNYKIKDLEPGYYIVIDAKANEKNDAYSRYLIDVVQDVTMEPKTSIPRLNKKVKGNNIKTLLSGVEGESSAEYVEDEKRNTATYKKESEEYNAEDYDIEFELKSYIPDVTGYSTYKFEVVDILGKGFDFDKNSVEIMLEENEYPKTREKIIKISEVMDKMEIVENYTIRDIVINEENYETYKKYFEEEGKEYPEGYAESNYGKTLILIELNDLVEQVKEGIVEKGQDIFVRYNAKLNGKGEVGNTPNINEAYVKYSNDPYHNEKITQTTTETTYTYTINLDLSKIEELKAETSEKVYLEGAEFEIYDKPETVKDRIPIATITTDEMLDSEGNIINKSGQALYSSLGAGIYYIKETKSPEGYNKLREEIVIEVKSVCDEYGTITWMVEEKNNNNLWLAQIGVKEGTDMPEIKLQVENTSGLQLPVTGGKGTTIFTVIGLCIMLVVILTLKSNKK